MLCPFLFVTHVAACANAQPEMQQQRNSVKKAVTYLANELSSWNTDHTCYSCHNNGDAIRALTIARDQGFSFRATEFEQTIQWLKRPTEWSKNGPDGEFNDRRLAKLQFAAALASIETRHPTARQPLQDAAALLASDLLPDGSWPGQPFGTIGSPITYGAFLATAQARDVLRQTGAPRFSADVDRANTWLRTSRPKSVLNAAAVLRAIATDDHIDATATRSHCFELIRRGQSREGGWGPYVTAATEPFDTAIVLLALHAVDDHRGHVDRRKDPRLEGQSEEDPRRRDERSLIESEDVTQMIDQAKSFLIKTQSPDGSWPETTRPADRESYAHRVSTTAWCLQSLAVTLEK